MALQSWDEHEQNFDRLLAMHRWRRRFWFLLVMACLSVAYLLLGLLRARSGCG